MDLEYKSFESVEECKAYAKRNADTCIYLGEDSAVINSATMIVCNELDLSICVFSDGTYRPLAMYNGDDIYVGYNAEVACINENKVQERIKTYSVFYDFITWGEYTVCVFELEVVCFVRSKCIWKKKMPGIVEDYRIENGVLFVSTDSTNVMMNIE